MASLMAQGEADTALLHALILVDVTPRMDGTGIARVIGFMTERMRDGFASLEDAAQTVADYLPRRPRPPGSGGLAKNLRLHRDGRYRWHWDPLLIDGPKPLVGDVPASADRLDAAAARLTLPVLLVRGGRSELVTMDNANDFLKRVPHAQFSEVSEVGHMVAGDKNDAFADLVIGFIDQLVV
jgi:pimeloyl-ACP methyl ester carboxylesterase